MYTFDQPKAPSTHHTQYFEMFGNRALYRDGWIASTTPRNLPWVLTPNTWNVATDYAWELYNLNEDYSQAVNLAAKEPKKLKEMQDLFWGEAAKYNVLPLDDSRIERFDVSNRPSLTAGRTRFTYQPGLARIPEGSCPDVKNKSFRITADLEVPEAGADGMLITQGGRFGGYGFYVFEGKPVFLYNLAGVARYRIAGKEKFTAGKHAVAFDFKYDGGGIGKGGTGTLTVDDKTVAEGKVERTLPFRLQGDETLDCGEDTGTPVSEEYADKMPFKFTGKLNKVVIDIDGKAAPAPRRRCATTDGNAVRGLVGTGGTRTPPAGSAAARCRASVA